MILVLCDVTGQLQWILDSAFHFMIFSNMKVCWGVGHEHTYKYCEIFLYIENCEHGDRVEFDIHFTYLTFGDLS